MTARIRTGTHRQAARGLRPLAGALLALCLAGLPARAAPTDDVRLRLETADGGWQAWADNHLAGPVEVRLASANGDVIGSPALPARATVPAGSSVLVARLQLATGSRGHPLALRLDTVPGSVNAKPRDYEYAFPLQSRDLRVEQGWGGRYSHADPENHYAVDFAAQPGTPVLAARDGVVMQVERDTREADGNANGGPDRNGTLIRILHGDGSMAVYAHLQAADVQIGARINRGQRIGMSGNSGFSTGPHLHFAVQVNRGMRLESIPFRMFSDAGILRFAEPGNPL